MEIKTVVIIGSGTMGSSIAQWFSQVGVKTYLCDQSLEIAESAVGKIEKSWEKLLSKKKFSKDEMTSFKNNLKITKLEDSPKETDLVIEAIVEDKLIKRNLFNQLHKIFSDKTILASNTSSLSISNMCIDLPIERKKRCMGVHFFNPATIMKLVEVIEASETDSSILESLTSWFNKNKKVAVSCKEGPGFIVNRLNRNFYGEPMRIIQNLNEEKIKDVDSALKKCGGFPMGSFELMDLIGIDVNLSVSKSVWEQSFQNDRFKPHLIQQQKVDAGHFGKKTKRGFYPYE
jgi:3-hydroxybutyryl-CoA dehydrogenase